MIPGSRRNLFKDQSFANIYNAYTRADKWPAGDAAGKVRGGDGRGSAPGMVQCRGTRRWGTVVGVWCLRYIYTGVVSNETQEIGAAINRPANLLKDKAEQGAGA